MKTCLPSILCTSAVLLSPIPAVADSPEPVASFSPNRMIVVNSLGQFVSFNVDHIADIRFVNIDTPPACAMELNEFSYERVSLDVTPNEECASYGFELVDSKTAASLVSDIDVIARLKSSPKTIFVADGSPVSNRQIALEGQLKVGEEYEVILAATDRYGTWDGVSRLRFTAPNPQIIGNPTVDVAVDFKKIDVVEVCMTPNEDVREYYYLFGTEGRYRRHFDTWKDTLDFKTFEDMVVSIGTRATDTVWQVWDALAPSTAYELIVVALDRRGNPDEARFTPIVTQGK